MENNLIRLEALIGKDKIDILKNKKVLICGVGGVGSFVAESLARSGIGFLTLIDFDVIDESNLNRQLMTNKNNIGSPKVEELKKRINSYCDCAVETHQIKIDSTFLLDKYYDYVIDCVDNLTAKFQIVKQAQQKNIKVISSLGTAKRLEIKELKYTTLDKTRNDPLARKFRELVKKEKYYKKIPVVYYDYPALPTKDNILGSAIFTPASAGLYIGSIVFNELIGEKNEI